MTTWTYKNFIIHGKKGFRKDIRLDLNDINTVKQLNILLEAIHNKEGGGIINLINVIKEVLESIKSVNADNSTTKNNKQLVSLNDIIITGVTDIKDKQSLANLIVSSHKLREDIKKKVAELKKEIN